MYHETSVIISKTQGTYISAGENIDYIAGGIFTCWFVGKNNHTTTLNGDSVVLYKIQHITWFDKAYISGRRMGEFL